MNENHKVVFISYCTEERETADLVKESLENNGYSCWVSPECIPPGSNYASEIPNAIEHAIVFVLILSSSSMNSGWVTKEVDCAITKKKVIIPFRIDNADINATFQFYLNNVQRIEAYRRIKMALSDLVLSVSSNVDRSDVSQSKIYLNSIVRHPNCLLMGRNQELQEISDAFTKQNIVTLCGIGGIGKSEITKEFARTAYSKKYDTIQFIDYRENLMQTISMVNFCNFNEKEFIENIGNQGNNQSVVEALYQRKLALLEECNEKTLLIIDGMDNLDDPYIDVLLNLSCHVLISTRCNFEQFIQINISPIKEQKDLLALFLHYYKDFDKDDDEMLETIKKIIELVSGHTMTIKLIAQFLETSGYEPSYIYEVLQKGKEDTIFEDDQIKHGDTYATLNMHLTNLFKITSFSEKEKLVMANLSLIPCMGVKKYQFKTWSNNSETMTIVQRLINKGWILSSQGKISLHPLVSSIIHHQIKPSTKLCHEFINNLIIDIDMDKYVINNMIEQMKEIALYAYQYLEGDDSLMVQFLMKVSSFESTYAYRNLFSFQEMLKTKNDIRQIIDEKGTRYQDFNHALLIMKEALALAQKIDPNDFKTIGSIYMSFSTNSFNMRRVSDAVYYNEQAIPYIEKGFGENSNQLFTIYRRLGINHYYLKKPDLSLYYFEKCFKMIEYLDKTEEDKSFNYSRIYLNFAENYILKNNQDKALEYYQLALEKIKNISKYDISSAELYIRIANILEKKNNSNCVVNLYKQALEIYETYTTDEEKINYLKSKIKEGINI